MGADRYGWLQKWVVCRHVSGPLAG